MRLRLALVLLSLAPQALHAAELDLVSRVDRVTVFPDAALVTRVGVAELPAGTSALVLRALPASIDPASVRVEGQGTSAFTIGAVDVRLTPGEAKPALDPDLEARITRIKDERDAVQARLAAFEAKKGSIERYAQASPEKLGVEGKPFEVRQWQAAWEAIGAGLAGVHEEIRQSRARLRDLEGELASVERARPIPLRPGAPKRDVTIAVEAGVPLKGELRVTYRVAGAAWVPLYDARLDTGAKDRRATLDLVKRAQISQRTGEEWSEVEMAVSTTRVSRATAAPDLPPLQVSFFEERARPMTTARPAAPAPAETRAAADAVAFPEAARADAVQQGAMLEAGAFHATYRVPGRVSVAQDGVTKTFILGQRRLEPALVVSAAPELEDTAYLKASFTHDDEAPLLPGKVSVHRDGTYVGRTRLKLTATGDQIDLGFGADDRVKVTRVPLRRRENEAGWIGQTKSDVREFKTTVRNLHVVPMRITIADRLPFSENAAITVEQLRETTPPNDKALNDKRGVLVWTYDYAPGEVKELRLAYRIRWPAERDVVFEPKPLQGGTPKS